MPEPRPPSLIRRLSMREPKDVVPLIVKVVQQNPQIMVSSRSSSSIPREARSRYVIENKTDINIMKSFFMKAGLSVHRAAACGEKSVLLNIHTPRRLFYYVQSVPAFTLTNLGMDRYDADMVLEDLIKEFGAAPTIFEIEREPPVVQVPLPVIIPTPVPSVEITKRPRKMTASEISVSKLMDSIIEITESENEEEGRKMIHNAVNALQRDKAKARRAQSKNERPKVPNDEDDINEIQEFFRFSGLGLKLSRRCAEKTILMQASSPKKLYKYVMMKKLKLTDLGMDAVDAEMVKDALVKTFYNESSPKNNSDGKMMECKSSSVDMDEYDQRRSEMIFDPIEMTDISSSSSSSSPLLSSSKKINDLSAFKQRLLKTEERENELESPDSQQSDVSSPHVYYNLGDSLNQIMSQSFTRPPHDYDNFMAELSSVMVHPDLLKKSKLPFLSSHHSAGVSNVLSGLPSRPSSVYYGKTKEAYVPTEILLLRVASVLKRNDASGFRKHMP